jgi:hypothetical protein
VRAFAQGPKAARHTPVAESVTPGRDDRGRGCVVSSFLYLQRTTGNQAVQRMVQTDAEDPEAELAGPASPRFAHDASRIAKHPHAQGVIQTKLAISELGDSYEREADRVAEHVMHRPKSQLQRKCACGSHATAGGECSECDKKKRLGLQTKLAVNEPGDVYEREAERVAKQVMATPAQPAVSGVPPHIQRLAARPPGQTEAAPASVDRVLASSGAPLEPPLREDMERRFGRDFSRVRVHSDAAAAQSAREVNARAYTAGSDIVFGMGQFAPGTQDGRTLLAHELTHVVQQGRDQLMLQRDGEKFRPCPPVSPKSWDSPQLYNPAADGGPYVDQHIALPYDKIAPLPDPTKGFDAEAVKKTFHTPSHLEQLYYDASNPQFRGRGRAVWLICNAVEAGARALGIGKAREIHRIGCLTIQNCGVNWDVALSDFSDATASGQRVRGLILKGFEDKSFEIGLNLKLIESASLLLAGLAAARVGMARTAPRTGTTTTPTPPTTTPTESTKSGKGTAATAEVATTKPTVRAPEPPSKPADPPELDVPGAEARKTTPDSQTATKDPAPRVLKPHKDVPPATSTPAEAPPAGKQAPQRAGRPGDAAAAEAELKTKSATRIEELNKEHAANQRQVDQINERIKAKQLRSREIRREANSARVNKRSTPKGNKLVDELTTPDEKRQIAQARKAGKSDAEIQDKVLTQKAKAVDAEIRALESEGSGPRARNAAIESELGKLRGILRIPDKAGGSYREVSAKTRRGQSQANHMPAKDAYLGRIPLSEAEGPSIWMTEADHMRTPSWGQSGPAKKWRQHQAELIEQGKFMEALEMDLKNIRETFPDGRYEKGSRQAMEYAKGLGPDKLKPKPKPERADAKPRS